MPSRLLGVTPVSAVFGIGALPSVARTASASLNPTTRRLDVAMTNGERPGVQPTIYSGVETVTVM